MEQPNNTYPEIETLPAWDFVDDEDTLFTTPGPGATYIVSVLLNLVLIVVIVSQIH